MLRDGLLPLAKPQGTEMRWGKNPKGGCPSTHPMPFLTFAACFHLSTMARVTGAKSLFFPFGPLGTLSSSSSPSPSSLTSCTRHRGLG